MSGTPEPRSTSASEEVASRVLPDEDALEAYEQAVERARLVRQAWEDAGRPVLTTGSRKQQVAHPLLKVIRDAELLADRLRLSVRPRRMGRPPVAVAQPVGNRSDRITRLADRRRPT